VRAPCDDERVTTLCRVWWAAPVAPEAAPHLVALLDAHEHDRIGRFRRPADRARYLAAHALTRLVLADAVGRAPDALVFDRTCRCGQQHGKPVLPGGPAFSFTHAGDMIGLAVHDGGPVGLDVEQARTMSDLPGMARHIASPAELGAAPLTADAFFRTWTRKEALLKATGEGLSVPMSAITLDDDGVRDWAEGAPDGPVWLHDLHPAPGYPAAVAGLGASAPAVVEADGNAVVAARAT
jgi:4'-phosphopantetheinyl transferase